MKKLNNYRIFTDIGKAHEFIGKLEDMNVEYKVEIKCSLEPYINILYGEGYSLLRWSEKFGSKEEED